MSTGNGHGRLLELSGVSKLFKARGVHVQAVREVSMAVEAGEVVGIVGESGSGKSTLGRIIVGLDAASEGEVILDGKPVGIRRDRSQRRKIQIVFQDPRSSLNPKMSILDSVQDFAIVHQLGSRAERLSRAIECLELVRLSESVASRRPAELSGGQLQRACIARALVPHPSLLVADEPTSSLDVSIQGQILNLLEELRDRLSIMLISHDMAVVRFLADRVYVMLDGSVVEAGPTDEVLDSPGHEYTRRLINAARLEMSTGLDGG